MRLSVAKQIDSDCPFFKFLTREHNFSNADMQAIMPYFKKQKVHRHQYLLQEGSVCNHDYFVLKGALRKFYFENDKEVVTELVIEGGWISEWDSQLSSSPGLFNIDALENSEILKIEKQDVAKLVDSNDKFRRFYMTRLQKGINEQHKRIACMQKPADKCYADFVTMFGYLEQRVSQTHIASFMGISRESLSRLKSQMIKK